MKKIARGIKKKLFKPFKGSRNRILAAQNVDSQGAPSSQKVEDTLHLHPSKDNKDLTIPEIPNDPVNQGPSEEPSSQVPAAPSGDAQSVGAALHGAHDGVQNMKFLGERTTSAVSAGVNAPDGLDAVDNFETTCIQPLKIADAVLDTIAGVHPYVKMALGVLSAACKIIIAQAKRDEKILSLYKRLVDVYGFMTDAANLDKIKSMRDMTGKVSEQTIECARFIREYSEPKSFWKRAGKNIVAETDDTITKYNNALDELMQEFRDRTSRDVAIFVHSAGETLDLDGMVYAKGAGLNTAKQCLSGTRMGILSQITGWINSTGDSVPRVMWLSGPAGKGKSAIAHTIANWFNETGGLGSCFCFDRHREADRRHEKIFSTIARDLADRDPGMKRALADAVKVDISLKNTTDIIQQWRKLLMQPLKKFSASSAGSVLIVIEALDESGGVETRRNLLRILAGRLQDNGLPQISELPSNFRILVTSRPLPDIEEGFEGADHILRLSMDSIPAEVAEGDIRAFVSEELKGLSGFQGNHFATLAKNADGLFEWARLACGYIKLPYFGSSSIECFNEVVNRDAEGRKNLLYDMYRLILTDLMPKDKDIHYEKAVAAFRSVMGQILATNEPLPLDSLKAMRRHFPEDHDRYEVDAVIKHMGSLLSGTTDSSIPIRPLHATFQEFLTDQSSSGDFFVERTKAQQRDLAFASLRVMEHGLSFNICDLKSSYLPNSEDPGLRERVEKHIPPYLSYACRFWPIHVQATDFDPKLAKETKSFFDHQRLFFWLEVLGLVNALSGAVPALLLVAKWLKGHTGYEGASSAAMDVQRFIQVFAGLILHSTPHLYVSALPFSPVNSALSKTFSARFPNCLHVASGRDINWTAVQTVIRGHTDWVNSVSFSPDGTRIATGSDDWSVRLWDAATGQPVGEPLLGHTNSVTSVSFSPDGTRIVSGSFDNTVRLWDVATRQPIGEPLLGHTESVSSVAFSRSGSRIVTGSRDKTVRLWNAATRQPVGEPLRGHTDRVNSVSFSLDETRIVSGSKDRTLRLWEVATGQQAGEPLEGHTNSVTSVSFSPDGTRIASGSGDKTVQLWDVAMGKPVCEPLKGHTELVKSVSFSRDGTRIVSGSDDKTVRLWDAATGQPIGQPLLGHIHYVNSVSFSPDETRIVSGSQDRTVRVWDAATGQPVGEPLRGLTNLISSVSLSPDGTRFATGSWDGTVQLLDTATGRPVGELLLGHTGMVYSISFSPDGTRIATCSADKTARLWDSGTGQPIGQLLLGHIHCVNSVSFSPDGTRIVSGSQDHTARVWDAATGQPVGEPLRGHTDSVLSAAFSPNGTRIATCSVDKTIRLWDAATGQPVSEPLVGHTKTVNSISFSPDGARIVSGSDDKTVRLWDVGTGQPVCEPLEGHTDLVTSVSFSRDGTRIVSGSNDTTVRLWDATTGQPIGQPLRGHTHYVNSVSFFPDGTRTISCSQWGGTVRVWYAVIGKSLHDHTEEDCSSSSPHGSCIPHPTAAISTPNPANDEFISFSSNSTHALRNTTELLAGAPHDHRRSTFALLGDDGWMMGPNGRLLFWVPPASRKAFRYDPRTALIIPRGHVELELSRMAHGTRWKDCYKDSS